MSITLTRNIFERHGDIRDVAAFKLWQGMINLMTAKKKVLETPKKTSKILYISYDGMLEPLGKSQVLNYLTRLARQYEIHLISFEKRDDWDDEERQTQLKNLIADAGISWTPLRYHKRPSALATTFDILQGICVGCAIALRHDVAIVHARSYVASVIGLALKKFFGMKYIFDMRGFWADERVDGGLWPTGGTLYRTAKWFERQFLLNADCVVSLTHAAVDEIHSFSYLQGCSPHFEIITTCADLDLFRVEEITQKQSSGRPFTLGYVGSVGVWYLFDEVLKCFQLLRKKIPDAEMLILNRGGHAYISERLHKLEIDPNAVKVEEGDHKEVALAMQQMDAGIFFYKPAFSRKATAPTKLGEFLGCGVPCLSNTGVGDMASILEKEQVGVAVRDFDTNNLQEAVNRLIRLSKEPDIQKRCREAALSHFSLENGVRAYAHIYQDLQPS